MRQDFYFEDNELMNAPANALGYSSTDSEHFLSGLWDRLTGDTDCARIEDRTHLTPKSKWVGKPRDMSKVYALVLHQTAGNHKNDPPNRYDKVTAHFVIKPNGQILQLHPLSARLNASHGLNAGSVAVEFAGNFPNTKGQWHPPGTPLRHQVSREQIEAGRCLVRHLMRTMGLTHVLAHRQSHSSRANDPGPDIWYHVGQWAVEDLGLKDGGPDFKVGSGNSIPDLWRTWGQVKPQPEFSEEIDEEIDPESPEHTSWLQRALNKTLGLHLPENGVECPATRSALRSFQRKHGMAVDGELSEEIESLLIQGGATPHRHPQRGMIGASTSVLGYSNTDSEQFIGDLWDWITDDTTETISYNVVTGQEYGPKYKSSRPAGLPDWARQTSANDAAAPHVEKLARAQGLGDTFVRTTVQMARTESGARFAMPAHTFDARPPSERPPGKNLITAWGVFQFNRDAWTAIVPREKRPQYRSWIANGERGCSVAGGCVFPWDATAYEELALPINRYAELFREVRATGGSETDAARGLRLWHISPSAYRRWRDKGKKAGFEVAWQEVSASHRQRITSFLQGAKVL